MAQQPASPGELSSSTVPIQGIRLTPPQCHLPSTRLHSALGQEILQRSRLNMKYRAWIVVPRSRLNYGKLFCQVCVENRTVFVQLCSLRNCNWSSSFKFKWMQSCSPLFFSFTKLVGGWFTPNDKNKKLWKIEETKREQMRRKRCGRDKQLVWKRLLWKLCLSCLSYGPFGVTHSCLCSSGDKLALHNPLWSHTKPASGWIWSKIIT